jgi:hypothetical protein
MGDSEGIGQRNQDTLFVEDNATPKRNAKAGTEEPIQSDHDALLRITTIPSE